MTENCRIVNFLSGSGGPQPRCAGPDGGALTSRGLEKKTLMNRKRTVPASLALPNVIVHAIYTCDPWAL